MSAYVLEIMRCGRAVLSPVADRRLSLEAASHTEIRQNRATHRLPEARYAFGGFKQAVQSSNVRKPSHIWSQQAYSKVL